MTENGISIMGVKRRWGKKAHLQTETLFNPLYIYNKKNILLILGVKRRRVKGRGKRAGVKGRG